MKEELIKFETAKLAKEKGFGFSTDIITAYSFDKEGKSKIRSCNNTEEDYYCQPTQSLLQKWLRKKHNIEVIPCPHFKRKSYGCEVYHYTEKNETGYVPIELGSFKTYEQALEKGLQEALNLI